MSKLILIPRLINTFISTPFSFLRRNGSMRFFSTGFVNSLINSFKNSSNSETTASEEFYLNIKSDPLSPKINNARILTKEEVEEVRVNEDDLLNIYIPIARENSLGDIVNYRFLNSNFNFIKKSNEIRMSGFYKNGTVYLSGFIVFGPSGELIDLIKPLEIKAVEGQVIYLKGSATLKYKINKKNDFYFDGLSIVVEDSPNFDLQKFTVVDGEDSDRELKSSFLFPIGLVDQGNYIALARGNVLISVLESSIRYFYNKVGNEALFATDYTYSFYPVFR